jgi:pimeloyl-ACP methyl ester carboxylesterase
MVLHYYLWGRGLPDTAPRILFLHGMGGIGSLWRPIAATLEDHYSILSVDQRGHGKSVGPKDHFSPLDFGRDVVETINETQFHPTWIVGHSMGVRTAMATYHLKPKWVRGIVLIDLGFSGLAGGGLGKDLAQFLSQLPEHFDSKENARVYLNAHAPDPSMAQYLSAVLFQVHTQWRLPFDRSALLKTLAESENFSIREWIQDAGQKKTPVLVLRGGKSKVWGEENFENDNKHFSKFPSIRFKEYPEAGHGLPFTHKNEFLKDLKDFVKSTKVPSP